ncbi:uncharacterized protein LOC131221020 [Magnolia sinica]|uniref:uncharacterized protein LOC131221020 n=1 Tax=Magnolia sinica TaxID=86752 RepID=UPI002657D60A|nr:uncharacterized protein LOC131221020 [Magnolia sinica]
MLIVGNEVLRLNHRNIRSPILPQHGRKRHFLVIASKFWTTLRDICFPRVIHCKSHLVFSQVNRFNQSTWFKVEDIVSSNLAVVPQPLLHYPYNPDPLICFLISRCEFIL